MKEVSRTEKVLENKIEQYYTDCRTKEGTKMNQKVENLKGN